ASEGYSMSASERGSMSVSERGTTSASEPATAVHGVDTYRLRRILLAAAAVFGVLFVVGVVPRLVLRNRLHTDADSVRTALPLVSTVNPRRAPAVIDLPLPGSMEPILETGIWARTNGYLKARYVDIGDHVNRGQLLADIDTPEVDQQLMQAIATMHQDKANVAKFEADL